MHIKEPFSDIRISIYIFQKFSVWSLNIYVLLSISDATQIRKKHSLNSDKSWFISIQDKHYFVFWSFKGNQKHGKNDNERLNFSKFYRWLKVRELEKLEHYEIIILRVTWLEFLHVHILEHNMFRNRNAFQHKLQVANWSIEAWIRNSLQKKSQPYRKLKSESMQLLSTLMLQLRTML